MGCRKAGQNLTEPRFVDAAGGNRVNGKADKPVNIVFFLNEINGIALR